MAFHDDIGYGGGFAGGKDTWMQYLQGRTGPSDRDVASQFAKMKQESELTEARRRMEEYQRTQMIAANPPQFKGGGTAGGSLRNLGAEWSNYLQGIAAREAVRTGKIGDILTKGAAEVPTGWENLGKGFAKMQESEMDHRQKLELTYAKAGIPITSLPWYQTNYGFGARKF